MKCIVRVSLAVKCQGVGLVDHESHLPVKSSRPGGYLDTGRDAWVVGTNEVETFGPHQGFSGYPVRSRRRLQASSFMRMTHPRIVWRFTTLHRQGGVIHSVRTTSLKENTVRPHLRHIPLMSKVSGIASTGKIGRCAVCHTTIQDPHSKSLHVWRGSDSTQQFEAFLVQGLAGIVTS